MEKKELTKNETKEKMIKGCKILNKIISIIMWIITGTIIAITTISVALTVIFLILPKNEANINRAEQFIEFTNNIGNEISEVGEKIQDFSEEMINNPIISMLGGIMIITILDNLIKVLKIIIEKETPFTDESIKRIKTISICSTILWFLLSQSLIYVITIWTMYYVFNYGYKLQQESDETL